MSKIKWEPIEGDLLNGTGLRGKIMTDYDTLVKVFGEPNIPSGDKTWNEWAVQFEYGDAEDDDNEIVNVAIYDWKEVSADDSRIGEYMWHIGAKTHFGVEMVYEALEQEMVTRPVVDTGVSIEEKLYVVGHKYEYK